MNIVFITDGLKRQLKLAAETPAEGMTLGQLFAEMNEDRIDVACGDDSLFIELVVMPRERT